MLVDATGNDDQCSSLSDEFNDNNKLKHFNLQLRKNNKDRIEKDEKSEVYKLVCKDWTDGKMSNKQIKEPLQYNINNNESSAYSDQMVKSEHEL